MPNARRQARACGQSHRLRTDPRPQRKMRNLTETRRAYTLVSHCNCYEFISWCSSIQQCSSGWIWSEKSHALKILIDFAYRCQHTFVMSNLSTWGWAHKNTRFKNKILQLIGELSPRVQKTRESQSSLKDLRGLCPLPPASLNVSSKHFVKHLSRQHILSDLNEKTFWREKVSQENIHAKCSYSLCCISAMQQTWSSRTMSILGNTKIQLVLIQPLLDVQYIRK